MDRVGIGDEGSLLPYRAGRLQILVVFGILVRVCTEGFLDGLAREISNAV